MEVKRLMLWMTSVVRAWFTMRQFHYITCLLELTPPAILAWEILPQKTAFR